MFHFCGTAVRRTPCVFIFENVWNVCGSHSVPCLNGDTMLVLLQFWRNARWRTPCPVCHVQEKLMSACARNSYRTATYTPYINRTAPHDFGLNSCVVELVFYRSVLFRRVRSVMPHTFQCPHSMLRWNVSGIVRQPYVTIAVRHCRVG
jgi:hypothetical protein